MKLYEFDGIDASLKLIPLAGRRALDAIGAKLSLEAFHTLSLADRKALVEAGSGETVDAEKAQTAILKANPSASPIEVRPEPAAEAPSPSVIAALGPTQPIADKVWQSLTPLDRYVLSKVTEKNRPPRVRSAYEEIVGASAVSTHVRPQGGVHMVSISSKAITLRKARAECWVTTSAEAFDRLTSHSAPKGDVLGTARLAGIMATKRTSDLIPLCHPLSIQHVEVDFEEHHESSRIRVLCTVEVEGKTGVEMEAMMGANVAALTIYDMLKSIDRKMEIGPSRLLEKSGGRSGTFSSSEKE